MNVIRDSTLGLISLLLKSVKVSSFVVVLCGKTVENKGCYPSSYTVPELSSFCFFLTRKGGGGGGGGGGGVLDFVLGEHTCTVL